MGTKYYSAVGTDGWGIRSYLDVTRTETATKETFVIDFGLQPTKIAIPSGWTAKGTLSGNIEWQTHSKKITTTVAINGYFKVGTITVERDRYAGQPRSFAVYWEGYLSGGTDAIKATYSFTIPALPTYTVALKKDNTTSAANLVTQTKTHGVTLTLSTSKPTKTGYTFSSWNTNTNGTGTNYASGGNFTANGASPNATIPLYPKWTPVTYTVKYNANGGSGAPANQTKTYGVNLTLSSVKPIKSGYIFVSWNTNSAGTGTSYNSGATYSSNASLTLYAQWEKAYVPPSISNLTAYRVDTSGQQEDPTGVLAKVEFNWRCGEDTDGTTVIPQSITIQWKQTTQSSYPSGNSITINNEFTGESGSISQTIGETGDSILVTDAQYDIKVILTPNNNKENVVYTTYVTVASFIIDINEVGNAIGIGRPAPHNVSGNNSQLWIGSDIYIYSPNSFKTDLLLEKDNDASRIQVKSNNNGEQVAFGQLDASTTGNFGLYDQQHSKWLIRSDSDANGRMFFDMPMYVQTLYNTKLTAPSTQNQYAYSGAISDIAKYNIILMRCECVNCRQLLVFCRSLGNAEMYLSDNNGTYIRGGYIIDWTNNKVGVRWVNGTSSLASSIYVQQVYGIL